MFDLTSIQPIIQFLHTHPHGGAGLLAFIVTFLEAMAVIGVIVPGSVTMTAIGILIGSAVIPAGTTFMWAIFGAITGDYVSYILGIYFQDRLHRIWPFKKHPQLLERSEKFFRDHGGKSVMIGRFFGPMRAMIPMVAGMFKMTRGRFLLAAIPSASIWAVGYMMPGVLLGALSLELPPRIAAAFTIGILAAIAVIWFVIWLMQHFFKNICRALNYWIMSLWNYMQSCKALNWITEYLADPREPDNHLQLGLCIAALILLLLFLGVFYSAVTGGIITFLDKPIFNLLCSMRNNFFDKCMVILTMLCQIKAIIVASICFLIWLIIKRYKYIALHWAAIVLLSTIIVSALKYSIFIARPLAQLQIATSESSFPSGHIVEAFALFGFLAVIIARELSTKTRKIAYILVGSIALLIAFSRLYLGAHWLSDILGSILIGTFIVLLVTISYRRRHSEQFTPMTLSLVVLGIFLAMWLGYSVLHFNREFQNYTLKWQVLNITKDQWRSQSFDVPLYRNNRLGKPLQAFNVQVVGDLNLICNNLQKNGYKNQPVKLSFQKVIQSLSSTTVANHLSILPQLHHNKFPVLVMTKNTENDDILVVFRLWQSDITINLQNRISPLWIGIVEYHKATPLLLKFKSQNHQQLFYSATNLLLKNLHPADYKIINVPFYKQPQEMRRLLWDGRVLLINYDV